LYAVIRGSGQKLPLEDVVMEVTPFMRALQHASALPQPTQPIEDGCWIRKGVSSVHEDQGQHMDMGACAGCMAVCGQGAFRYHRPTLVAQADVQLVL